MSTTHNETKSKSLNIYFVKFRGGNLQDMAGGYYFAENEEEAKSKAEKVVAGFKRSYTGDWPEEIRLEQSDIKIKMQELEEENKYLDMNFTYDMLVTAVEHHSLDSKITIKEKKYDSSYSSYSDSEDDSSYSDSGDELGNISSLNSSHKKVDTKNKLYTHKNRFGMFSPKNLIKNLYNKVEWDATTTQRRNSRIQK